MTSLKHSIIVFYAVIFISIISCNDATVTSTIPQDSLAKDSSLHLPNDSITDPFVNTRPPQGIYQVVLPCKDCKGIQHTIAFYPDLTFKLEEEKMGKKEGIIKMDGYWKVAEGIISIHKDQLVRARYAWQGDTLVYIEPSGNRIGLVKLMTATENKVWSDKKKEGLEFFGVGNEPFWNIEIDQEKHITFHLADWPKPVKFKSVKPVVSSDSTVYTTSNTTTKDTATLQVTIYNTFCSDGMSDYMYDNKVKVFYKRQVYSGCGILYK
ncbi:MAG: copper resistance protein NlpE N-terminal domain-containing protein [Chitinophagaceae bacterium]